MHSFIDEPFDYPNFKQFASLLLKGFLNECIEENYKLLRKHNPPILDKLSHLSEEEKKSLLGKAFNNFLEDITSDQTVKSTIESIRKWKNDEIGEISKDNISSSDILVIYSVRKQIFLAHAHQYTDSLSKAIELIKEMEEFFLRLERYTLHNYVEIQKETLIEEKEFSELIFNNTVDGILAWDQNYIITAWNAVFEKQYTIKSSEIVGRSYFDVFPAYIGSVEAAAMERVLRGEKVHFPDSNYRYKEGSFEMNMIPLKDIHGKITGGLSIVHDITERKKTEKSLLDHREELQSANEELKEQQEELRRSHFEIIQKKRKLEESNNALEKEILNRKHIEAELKAEKIFIQAILNNMQEGIVACDEDGQLSFFNEATRKFHGIPYKQLPYKDWPRHFNLYNADGLIPLSPEHTPLYRAFRGKVVKDVEMVILPADGDKVLLSINGQAMFDEQGKKLGAVVVMHDITKKREIENKLQKSLEFYLTILQDFPALIWRSDTTGKCDYFNNTWLEFTGRTFEQEYGYGWAEGVHPEDFDQCVNTYNEAFRVKTAFSMQYRLKHSDGEYRWLMDFGKPLYDLSNNFLGFLGSCYDIQEQKEADERISEKNVALSAALDKLKDAEDNLKRINSELELRVHKRTEELSASEEELKQTLDQTIDLNKRIAQSEKFLSSIIDQSPVSTCIYDALGNMIRANKASLKLFGVPHENQGVGKYNILKDESLINTPYYSEIESVFKDGKIAKFVISYNVNDVEHLSIDTGVPVTVITTIFPIKDIENEVMNAIIQHEDITERKRAEEALKSSEEQLRLITDSLPVLIAYVDKKQQYRFNNKAYEDWFKIKKENIYGQTVEQVVGRSAYKKLEVAINKVLGGEELYYEALLPYRGAGQKYVAINYIPHIVNNEVTGYYTLISDISKQKEVQRALEVALQDTNDKNEELQKINNDLDNFIYIASHDLKSPIVNLEGLVSALNKRIGAKTNEAEHQILEMIGQSIEKFKNTLKNLTEITKAQRNLEDEKEILDIHSLIQDIKDEIQPMILESNASIIEILEVKDLLFVPVNLRSIIYNLLTNAIKYRKDGIPSEILIKSYRKGSNVVLSVKDNGLGLSQSQQSKLFTMFKRMHSHVEGTGIGLYILKRIAENSGGKVEVESALNVGTEFKVYFRDN